MNRYLRVIGPLLRGLAGLPLIRQVIALGGRLVEAGTDGYPVDVKRRLMILNMIAYLIFVTTVGYAFQFAQMPEPQYRPIVWINIALAVVAALVPFSHRINDLAGAFLILISEYAGLTAFAIYLGTNGGVQLQFFVAAAAPFVVFGPRRLKLVIAVVIGGLALHLYTWFNYPPEAALIQASRQILDDNYRQAAITTFGLIAATVWYAFKLAEQAKAETDRLLRNILPDTVVERLKLSPDAPIADTFGDASILSLESGAFDYVDVVGEVMTGKQRLFAKGVVLGGKWWHTNE